jgi:hypothetical protein
MHFVSSVFSSLLHVYVLNCSLINVPTSQPTHHRGTDHHSPYLKRASAVRSKGWQCKIASRLSRWSCVLTSTATNCSRQGLAGGLECQLTRVLTNLGTFNFTCLPYEVFVVYLSIVISQHSFLASSIDLISLLAHSRNELRTGIQHRGIHLRTIPPDRPLHTMSSNVRLHASWRMYY